jgi:hypothetical protein
MRSAGTDILPGSGGGKYKRQRASSIPGRRPGGYKAAQEIAMSRRRALRDLVEEVRFVREELDDFLDHRQPNWGYFDGELGYVHRSIVWKDGVDGSFTRGTYLPHGPRLGQRHADRPCRINTYGDSFTEGACVSDGETWQEVLAARLGEPVRNFGVGGYSSYQAYRRMRRIERGDTRAATLVLTLYLDEDSYRNLDRFRWVRWHRAWNPRRPDEKFRMVHANPGCHLRYDPSRRGFVEEENACPTEASLYQLTDPDFVHDLLEHDFTTQIVLAQKGYAVSDPRLLRDCAESLGLPLRFADPGDCADEATRLHHEVALRSAIAVIDLWMAFCAAEGRVGLIATASDQGWLEACARAEAPPVHGVVAYLRERGIPHFDGPAWHALDWVQGRPRPEAASAQLYNYGHYSPSGNFHFAQGLSRAMVELLDPAPALYDERLALELSRREGFGRNFALEAAPPRAQAAAR